MMMIEEDDQQWYKGDTWQSNFLQKRNQYF